MHVHVYALGGKLLSPHHIPAPEHAHTYLCTYVSMYICTLGISTSYSIALLKLNTAKSLKHIM